MSGLSIKLGKTTITAVMQTIGLAELLMISDELAHLLLNVYFYIKSGSTDTKK